MFKYTHVQRSWMCVFLYFIFLTPTQLLTQSDYTTVNISGGIKHVLKSGFQMWQSVFKPRAPLYITCVYLNIQLHCTYMCILKHLTPLHMCILTKDLPVNRSHVNLFLFIVLRI